MIIPLVLSAVIANPTHPQSQPLVAALYREFEPTVAAHMYQIALCESTLRQFYADGTVVKSNTNDFGIMQINSVHDGKASKLGLDYKGSLEDNVKMAKIVYDEREAQGLNGFGAWTCAKKVGVI